MAMQVISRIIKVTKVNLPIQYLFERPTVSELAVLITGMQIEQQGDDEIIDLIQNIKSMSESDLHRAINELKQEDEEEDE
jgi:polyketide synthase PksJ